MFKNRYLSILIVLLLIISLVIVTFGIEWYRIYAVCRDRLWSHDVYGREYHFKYEFTRFYPPPITVAFDDGSGGVRCYVRRSGLGWEVNKIIGVWPYP